MKKFKYPKLSLLLFIYFLTIICLSGNIIYPYLQKLLLPLGVFGTFLGGFFYAYGFTAAPATVVLLALAKQQSYLSAGIIGGIGALLSDTLIYLFIKHSFIEEINLLKKERIVLLIVNMLKSVFGFLYKFLLPLTACIFIASPLPTEFGVALLATMKNVSIKNFLLIAYVLHTAGIFIVLSIGNLF